MTSLIYKVLSNTATAEEVRLLRHWIGQSKENKEEYDNIKLLWSYRTTTSEINQHNSAFAFEKIKRAITQKKENRSFPHLILVSAVAIGLFFIYIYRENQHNQLTFENEPFSRAVETIEARYHVTIYIGNRDILSCPVTGTFYDVKSPSKLVSTLADVVGARHEVVTDKEYRLIGGSCTQTLP